MKKLLIIAPNWPAPNYSAAGVRLMQLVAFFKREKYQITIASTADKASLFASDFAGIELASIQLNHSSFDEFVQKLDPDVVLFDRFVSEEQFGWRVAENAPNALRILDTEDLHSLRKSREEAFIKSTPWSETYWRKYDITKREIASILRCDLSLIISSFEMELLETIVSKHSEMLLHLPFMVDKLGEDEIAKWPLFEERNDFVFIGFGGHSPNIDAIEYLKIDIWPLVHQKLPKAKLYIYGGNLPEKIHQFHNEKRGFLVEGWAENAQDVISKARVLLAPLRFGAGQKGKLLDAMLCGTPSITTSMGAEGMHGGLNWNGKICNEPNTFAEAAIESYHDKVAWLTYQKKGLTLIEQVFEKAVLEKRLQSKLEQLQENLSAHRNLNFIGSLLLHQTLASTKYMSKWIEIKDNK